MNHSAIGITSPYESTITPAAADLLDCQAKRVQELGDCRSELLELQEEGCKALINAKSIHSQNDGHSKYEGGTGAQRGRRGDLQLLQHLEGLKYKGFGCSQPHFSSGEQAAAPVPL